MKTRFLVGESLDYTHLTYPYIVSSKPISILDTKIRSVSDYFLMYRPDIESIDMPNLISTGGSAFAMSPNIKSVNLPMLTTVSDYVFQESYDNTGTNLESVDFPSLKRVGYGFMMNHTNLRTFSASSLEIAGHYFMQACSSLESVSLPKLKAFGLCPFSNCSNLKSLDLPNLTYVIDYSGNKNTSNYYNYGTSSPLEFLSIPKMKTIPYSFFIYYSNLKSVYAPNAKYMYDCAFSNASRLSSFYAPELETLGSSCFAYATCFSIVSFPKVVTIHSMAFYGAGYAPSIGSGVIELNLPECQTIGSNAFYAAYNLSSVYLPKLKTIWNNAFQYCYNLGSIELPNLEMVQMSAFQGTGYGSASGYKGLTYISAPKLSIIYNSAFAGCGFLSSIYMPRAESIYPYAFQNCYALEEADLPLCASLASGVFQYCSSLKTVKLGYGRKSAGLWPAMISLYSYQFTEANALENLYLTNTVSISSYTFSNKSNLKRVDIVEDFSQTVGAIYSSAFYSCGNLSSVNLNNVLIYSGAFYGCPALETVILNNIASIGYFAFAACPNIKTLSIRMKYNGYLSNYIFNSPVLNSVYIETIGTEASFGALMTGSIFGSSCSRITSLELKNIGGIGNIFYSASYKLDKLTANMAGVANPQSRYFALPANSYVLSNATEINAPLHIGYSNNRLNNVSRAFIVSGSLSATFYGNSKIESIYFGTLNGDIVKTTEYAYPFFNTPITNSSYLGRFGSIYVPESQYDTYINDGGWASLSSRFVSYSSEYYSTILSMFKQY